MKHDAALSMFVGVLISWNVDLGTLADAAFVASEEARGLDTDASNALLDLYADLLPARSVSACSARPD